MIQLEGISKSFRVSRRSGGLSKAVRALFQREHEQIHALRDLSFRVDQGEMVGYIGPNGAGKSTTIKIMCGVLRPDSGSCMIDGRVPWIRRVEHAKQIGVVFGQRSQLWWDVPVIDSFELIRDIYAVDQAAYARRLTELTELLAMGELLRTPARSLSLGQRMRCELAASLLHGPRILFLDEPTIGLDAVSKLAVRGFIRRMNQEQGTTVILTTHDMQDVEALAQRILLIGRGRLLLDGSLQELKRRASGDTTLELIYRGEMPKLRDGLSLQDSREGRLVLRVDQARCPVDQAIQHLALQVEILDVSVSAISAEEMVARLYQKYAI